jgi:nicotinate phosphoribosyltransferase
LAARAAYIGGFDGTATALAGMHFDMPIYGTMAHSFIQAHDDEERAFLDFAVARPSDTIFLIDTYDVEAAARIVVRIAEPLRAKGIAIRGVRIDSGDLAAHARAVRVILDEAGLQQVRIVVSGGLDEPELRSLISSGAPIDSFGIGTSLTTSQDLPALDCAYKLVAYGGQARRKRSEGKLLWPGAKQVFRRFDRSGDFEKDVVALDGETIAGEPLLRPVMRDGKRQAQVQLTAARERAFADVARLPEEIRDPVATSAYPVGFSAGLRALSAQLDELGR